MSTVQTNTGVSNSLLTTMNGSTTSTATSSTDDAQNRFMTLLVTQMKNQDPLNPMDNAQITSQLAQLSTVTGIDKLNTTVQSLMTSFQSNQSIQAAGMIGHGVLTAGSTMELSNGVGVMGVELTGPADSVKIAIKDGAGNVIRNISLDAQEAGVVPVQWDGTTDTGAAAADGQYTFSVQAVQGGQSTTANALAYGQVASVSTNSKGVSLNVPGIGAVSLTDIRQIL
ncbi:MAG: flagellar hook assembly protein FlgD [Burkholderiaceae bacterium]